MFFVETSPQPAPPPAPTTPLLSFTTPDAGKIGFLSPNGAADGFILVLRRDIRAPLSHFQRRGGGYSASRDSAGLPSAVQARVSCLIKSCQSDNFPQARGDRSGVAAKVATSGFLLCFLTLFKKKMRGALWQKAGDFTLQRDVWKIAC